jgi:hypothetical protein
MKSTVSITILLFLLVSSFSFIEAAPALETLTGWMENFDAPVDLDFWTPNKKLNEDETPVFAVTQENGALKVVMKQSHFADGQMYDAAMLGVQFDLTGVEMFSVKIKVEPGAMYAGQEVDSVPFMASPFSVMDDTVMVRQHSNPTIEVADDGQWHELLFDWTVPDEDQEKFPNVYTNITRLLLETVTWPDTYEATFWIDDFKVGDAAVPVPPDIIWVSGNIQDSLGVDSDQGFIDMLTDAGYVVQRESDTITGKPLTDEQKAVLESAELVIVSRSTNSGTYNSVSWNSVKVPMILTTSYLSRANRWQWFDNDLILGNGDSGAPLYEAADPTHPIFNGVMLDGNNQTAILDGTVGSGNTSISAGLSVGNGQILATVADTGSVAVAFWPQYTVFHDGTKEKAADHRMLFNCGARETASGVVPAYLQGLYNLTDDGATMFLNAVDWMINLPPSPVEIVDITDLDNSYIKGSNDDSLWTGPASNGSPGGEQLVKLIDNDVDTKYLVAEEMSWIEFSTTTLSKVTSYSLTSANDAPDRDLNSWLFQAWDGDAMTWVTLDSVVDQPVWEERFQTKTFEFANDNFYNNYRLYVMAINGNAEGLMQVAEWEIWGELGDEVPGDVTNYSYLIKGSNDHLPWTGPASDGSPDGEKIRFLVDNNINTKYLVGADTSWLDIYTTKMSNVTSYTITSANDAPGRDPNTWVLQGWDRATATWVTIDSVAGQPEWEERFMTKTFECANPGQWFSTYRLHILALNGDTDGLLQIAELQLLGEIGDDVGADITDLPGKIAGQNDDLPWTGPASDGSPDGERIEKLIDNDLNTKFLVGAEMSWIEIYTLKNSRIHGYALTSANDAPGRDPSSWLLQGWDGGNNVWVTLDSVAGQPEWEERFMTKTWDVDNDSLWFSTYRLHILGINGDADGLMQIAELQLFGELSGTVAYAYGLSDVESKDHVVQDFRLNQNYPNPFNPTTTISFALPNTMDVKLTVFDILGRRVTVLVDEKMSPGLHNVTFDGLQHASGVYFYHLKAGDQIFYKKMMLVK